MSSFEHNCCERVTLSSGFKKQQNKNLDTKKVANNNQTCENQPAVNL